MAQEYDLGLVKGETGERGPEGPAGQRGPTGLTPNITIGNVETLAPGSPATVTRRSDSPDEAPVFDFGLPTGANSGDMMASVYDPNQMHQDIFAYTDRFAGRAGATVVVAAANSRNQDRADLVCDGVADQLTLQQAVYLLPEVGGSILLLEGDYWLDLTAVTADAEGGYSLLQVPGGAVTLRGVGKSTCLHVADNVLSAEQTGRIIHCTCQRLLLEDLAVDGNQNMNSGALVTGISVSEDCANVLLQKVYAANCSATGIWCHGGKSILRDSYVENCDTGYDIQGSWMTVIGLQAMNNTSYGIKIGSGSLILKQCRANGSGIGIRMDNVVYFLVEGNIVQENTSGIRAYGCQYGFFVSNWVGDEQSSFGTGEYTLHLSTCKNVLVLLNFLCGKAFLYSGCTNCKEKLDANASWNVTY